jgi:hypothetical protein
MTWSTCKAAQGRAKANYNARLREPIAFHGDILTVTFLHPRMLATLHICLPRIRTLCLARGST